MFTKVALALCLLGAACTLCAAAPVQVTGGDLTAMTDSTKPLVLSVSTKGVDLVTTATTARVVQEYKQPSLVKVDSTTGAITQTHLLEPSSGTENFFYQAKNTDSYAGVFAGVPFINENTNTGVYIGAANYVAKATFQYTKVEVPDAPANPTGVADVCASGVTDGNTCKTPRSVTAGTYKFAVYAALQGEVAVPAGTTHFRFTMQLQAVGLPTGTKVFYNGASSNTDFSAAGQTQITSLTVQPPTGNTFTYNMEQKYMVGDSRASISQTGDVLVRARKASIDNAALIDIIVPLTHLFTSGSTTTLKNGAWMVYDPEVNLTPPASGPSSAASSSGASVATTVVIGLLAVAALAKIE